MKYLIKHEYPTWHPILKRTVITRAYLLNNMRLVEGERIFYHTHYIAEL